MQISNNLSSNSFQEIQRSPLRELSDLSSVNVRDQSNTNFSISGPNNDLSTLAHQLYGNQRINVNTVV